MTRTPSLYSFLEKKPKQNFGVLHPSTILLGPQNYIRILEIVPPIHTYGTYQSSPITIYPIFHGKHPASKDTKLEGQYVGFMMAGPTEGFDLPKYLEGLHIENPHFGFANTGPMGDFNLNHLKEMLKSKD